MSADVMKTMKTAERRRRGLTLIEAAMVLVILALVIGGVMLYYQSANTGRQTTEAAGQLAQIQQSVRSMYAGQSTYGTGSLNASIMRALPTKMVSGTNVIRHAFNDGVTVTGINNTFSVLFSNVPVEACTRLAVQDFGRAVTSLVVGPGTGGNGTATTKTGVTFTPAEAQAACGSAGAANMTWTMY